MMLWLKKTVTFTSNDLAADRVESAGSGTIGFNENQ